MSVGVVHLVPEQQVHFATPARLGRRELCPENCFGIYGFRHLGCQEVRFPYVYSRPGPGLVGTVIEFNGCWVAINRYPIDAPHSLSRRKGAIR